MTAEMQAKFEEVLKATGSVSEAIKALSDRTAKLEAQEEARKALGGEASGLIVPEGDISAPAPPPPAQPRDPAQVEKEGAIDPCAFMRMVVFSKTMGPDRAALMGCSKGSKEYRDAAYTLEKTMFATERRDANIGTGSAGGFIAPEEWQTVMVELLRARLVAAAAGVTMMPGQTSAVIRMPRQSAAGTGYWVGENAAITPSQQTYEQITMTPKIAAGLTKASLQFIKYSNPAGAQVITNDLVATLKNLIDLAIFRGSGVSDQPTGIANTSGITTVAFGVNGATPTHALLESVRLALHESNSNMQRVAWVTPPKGETAIRNIVDSQGRPLYLNNIDPTSPAGPGTLFGWPVLFTTALPTNLVKGASSDCYELYLCDFAEVMIPMWGAMEVAATGETTTAFTNLQSWIRVNQEMDVGIRHPAAMVYVSDARP